MGAFRRCALGAALLVAGAGGGVGAQEAATLPPPGSRVRITLRSAPADPRQPSVPLNTPRVEGTLLGADTASVRLRMFGRYEWEFAAQEVRRLEVPRPGKCRGGSRQPACALAGVLVGAGGGWLLAGYLGRREEARVRNSEACRTFPDTACDVTDYGPRRRLGTVLGAALGLAVGWGIGQDRWAPSPAWPPAPR